MTIEEVAAASNIGSCLRFDTLLKIAPKFWQAWGIALDPEDPAVKQAAKDGYKIEWTEVGPEANNTVRDGANRAGLGDANGKMNEAMAKMLASRLGDPRQLLTIVDLGCGPGGSTLALHARIASGGKRLSVLIDPSKTPLANAARDVITAGWDVRASNTLVEEWLTEGYCHELSHADAVLMGASLHHMDVDLVLSALRKHLLSGALIGVADWCHPMLCSPAHFRMLAQTLDSMVEPGILARFDENFPTSEEERPNIMRETSLDRMALLSMAGKEGFWVCHALECKEKGVKPMFSPYEGHRPVTVWFDEFRRNGFGEIEVTSITQGNNLHTVFLLKA